MTTNNFLHRVPEPLRPAVARVLTDDGQPTRSLLSLVDLHGLKHNGSFASIVQAMQKAWRPMKNGVALNAGELPQDDAFSDYVRRQTIYHLGALGLGNSQLQRVNLSCCPCD